MKDTSDYGQQIDLFWKAYKSVVGLAENTFFSVVKFGDTAELTDALVDLVIAGTKRASASLVSDYLRMGQPLPRLGDLYIVIDGASTPRCIVRTVNVDVKRMGEVDASFAWDEGEGDRSLDWWVSSHRRYFARQCVGECSTIDDRTEVVLERFEVIWPPEVADRPGHMKLRTISRT